MEAPKPFSNSIIFIVIFLLTLNSANVNCDPAKSGMSMAMSLYDGADIGDAAKEGKDLEGEEAGYRRSLLWPAVRYYISYATLSADRVPCPPRSGRSYYTDNCHLATGPVRPYYRGCAAITRCRS